MSISREQTAEEKEFWDMIRCVASRTRGLPAWTQAGIVVSENFNGPHAQKPAGMASRDNPAFKGLLRAIEISDGKA